MNDRRILLVHAHPDDETIGSGALMAKYVAEGAQVSLVTCTLGEEGEVLVDELLHLHSTNNNELGPHRQIELQNAMDCLGVTDWQLLGGPGTYRDSGMMGEPSNKSENCFWQADLLEAAARLVPIIREKKPQILITYDDFGGYGHPDHIQAHRVAMYGAQLAAAATFRPELGEAWDIPKIYWTALSKPTIRRAIQELKDSGDTSDIAMMDPDDLQFGVEDDVITTEVDGRKFQANKVAAMKAYPTQINMQSGFFALAEAAEGAFAIETFRLVKGQLGPVGESGREEDIFAGI